MTIGPETSGDEGVAVAAVGDPGLATLWTADALAVGDGVTAGAVHESRNAIAIAAWRTASV